MGSCANADAGNRVREPEVLSGGTGREGWAQSKGVRHIMFDASRNAGKAGRLPGAAIPLSPPPPPTFPSEKRRRSGITRAGFLRLPLLPLAAAPGSLALSAPRFPPAYSFPIPLAETACQGLDSGLAAVERDYPFPCVTFYLG